MMFERRLHLQEREACRKRRELLRGPFIKCTAPHAPCALVILAQGTNPRR